MQLKIDDARVTAEECVGSEIHQRILSPMWRAHSCGPHAQCTRHYPSKRGRYPDAPVEPHGKPRNPLFFPACLTTLCV